jgi:RNA polymerase sigma factor (sigma-70 family)
MNQLAQAGRRALARLCQHDLLSLDEERRLFGRLKILKAKGLRYRRSTDAKIASIEAVAIRNRIVESNLRLVVSLARHFAAPERSLEDLVSEASLPLIRCVESFDSGRGTRFSTYATRALTNFFARLRRQDYRRQSRFHFGDDRLYVTWTGDRSIGSDNLIQAEECRRLAEYLARLSSRERALVTDRFGLTGDHGPLTFRELGARHGLSKERVRVITSEAIARLRQSFDESPLL